MNYVQKLEESFFSHRDSMKAIAMKQYMRNRFEFLGISSPERKQLYRLYWKNNGLPAVADLPLIIRELWEKPERELHYFAMETCKKLAKHVGQEHINTLEYMLQNKQWWDTVDFIAADLVGHHFTRYPALTSEYFDKWNNASDLWLNRTALLFQLKYGERTDTKLLSKAILHHNKTKEFFINKAIGWALRQYSKTNSIWVKRFIKTHELSNLSRKEARKYL